MAKMKTSDLTALLAAERQTAMGALTSSKLTEERSRALDYYLGDMSNDMPAPDGRSQAVSSDVSDTVEGMMPMLMDIFASGEEVIQFEPVGQEDEEAAQQETDYVNHVFMQKNPGFLTLYTFIKDALLSKVGVVKVFWEETEKDKRETFYDQPDDVYALLSADKSINIIEHSEHPGPDGTPLHDMTILTSSTYGCARVEPVPPEEFLISRKARSVRNATYTGHRPPVTQGDLIDQGWDEEQIKSLPTRNVTFTQEETDRNTVEDWQTDGDTINDSARLIDITEHYVKCDYNGTGKPVIIKVTTGGAGKETNILKKGGKAVIEEVEEMPFAAMTPIIITHRFWGRSLADAVMDIMRIKTALLRALLDNAYMANNMRIEVAENTAGPRTIDDLLSNKIGGIVRTKSPGGLIPIPNNPLGPQIFPLLEYIDGTREFRTGVTKQGMGVDANALQNQSATAVNQAYTAAQAKMKLIARIFAETGIKDLFSLLHGTIRRNGSKPETVRLRNKWVPVNPRDFKERDDMTINVGLGTGSKTERVQHLMMILGMQKEALANHTGLATPDNLYNTADKLCVLLDLKSAEPYFVKPDPNNPPPPPPPDPKLQELQMKAQLEEKKMQMDQANQEQMSQRQASTEAMQAQADIAVQSQKTQHEMELASQKFEFEKQLKLMDHQLKVDLAHRDAARQDKQANQAADPVSTTDGTPHPIIEHVANLAAAVAQMAHHASAPKRVVRGPDGRAVGVETVTSNG